MNRSEAESLRDAIGTSLSEGRNEAAWCHRCGQHRVGEPAPDPERCILPTGDHAPRRRRTKGWANASDRPRAPVSVAPADPQPRAWPQPGRLPLLGVSRQGSRQVGASKALRKGLRYTLGPKLRNWHRQATEGIPPAVLRAYLKEVVPMSFRPGELVDLPTVAVNLYRDYHKDVHFLALIGDGMSVEVAGRVALNRKKQASYDRKDALEAAGGPDALFRANAVGLFAAGKIPPGNRIEDDGWARPFFIRLAGGPDALAALKAACATAARAQLTIRQRQADGDVASVQVILFGQHSGLIGGVS
jgi:hypothetical protein